MTPEATAHDDAVQGTLFHLRDYLTVRARQAARMNPQIANVVEDIVWTQMIHLRQVLEKLKTFGPERVRVADGLTGDDETRRKALLSHTDQNAVVYEVIDRADQQKSGRVVDMAIHDTRTLFHALNPSLEFIVQLVQHWSYWDLPDAADLYHFDRNARRLAALSAATITDEIRSRYRMAMRLSHDQEMTDNDMVKHELRLLDAVVQRFAQRRSEEEAYVTIIRRDEEPSNAADQEIMKVARHLMAMESLQDTSKDVDPAMLEYFARAMQTTADAVTREQMIDFERRCINEAKRRLQKVIADDRRLGDPYDYKAAQASDLAARFAAIKAKYPFGEDFASGPNIAVKPAE